MMEKYIDNKTSIEESLKMFPFLVEFFTDRNQECYYETGLYKYAPPYDVNKINQFMGYNLVEINMPFRAKEINILIDEYMKREK